MFKKQKGFTIVELGIVLIFLLLAAAVLGGLYMACHFIFKFW